MPKSSATQLKRKYHDNDSALNEKMLMPHKGHYSYQCSYNFQNFFHPYVGEIITKLNKSKSLQELFDPKWQKGLTDDKFFESTYDPLADSGCSIDSTPKKIDLDNEPYANYNWELFFHIPLMVAVHLSKNQRFPEAQRWFHYIWNPLANVSKPEEQWKFLLYNESVTNTRIESLVAALSTTDDKSVSNDALDGYNASIHQPFKPHAVARTRTIAYQYNVVMKYLDNLIAWGDKLFVQDTIESINEATQLYVLAANILGKRPEKIPQSVKTKPKCFADLKKNEGGVGIIGDFYTDMEAQFPLNLTSLSTGKTMSGEKDSALFGIGHTLYFCIPPNPKMLGYWDTVADRLFKIRHCMNIEGIVRPLALFDPPIDPGMLVKAAAAGIDISSIVNGLNKPVGPVRSLYFIQKTLELCNEVRGLGNALLSALEKRDSEHIALLRQSHEIKIQQMTQEVKFLQWKQTQENTTSLLTSRASTLARLKYYKMILGVPADPNASDTLNIDHSEKPDAPPKLTEENFDEVFAGLVGQYDISKPEKTLTLQPFSGISRAMDSSPGTLSGYSGDGKVYLSKNEDSELNTHLPLARDAALAASVFHGLAAGFTAIPDMNANLHFWGLGGTISTNVGTALVQAAKIAGDVSSLTAGWEQNQAGMTSKYSSYERRADEWIQQHNSTCYELMQNGRQILTSLISEQFAHQEYLNVKQQISNSQEIDQALHDKFTNEDLYLWMQGEISRLYYEYYRFAFDTARKAEKTMKQELMRPDLDSQDFISFNYWDGGRKGLLSGEALYLDVKKMEMAYHENNKREIELTRHISLRQLNPLALLSLKVTGTCQVTIPEWLYDLDCPGHYIRRIKNVAVSIPCIAGPYASVNCTLSLLNSSIRTSAMAENYLRDGADDPRFTDYSGAIQYIVTSSGQNDSGLFETNLRDERFLPFEGAGAISTWKLDLPKEYRGFNYDSISDVILHIRYTSRLGVEQGKVTKAIGDLIADVSQTGLALLFNLKHDFSKEWNSFKNGEDKFTAEIQRDYFPAYARGKTITVEDIEIYGGNDITKHHSAGNKEVATSKLNDDKKFYTLEIPKDDGVSAVMSQSADNIFLIIKFSIAP